MGLAAQLPFMVTPLYTGPLAAPLRNLDLAWLVGFVVTGVVYLLFVRLWETAEVSVDVEAEARS